MTSESDREGYMRRAIELAAKRVGLTAENPPVGCVIVSNGQIVGEAATAPGGRPHAEEQALALAGAAAQGASAYVTLEPCGERSSGENACSIRLLQSGVSEVFIACADGSPFASGRGTALLLGGGVAVTRGLLEAEAAPLYAQYRHQVHGGPERSN